MVSIVNQNNAFGVYLHIDNKLMQFATEQEAREYLDSEKENEDLSEHFSTYLKKEVDKYVTQ